MNWKQTKTAEKLELIKAAWRPGISASDIAAAIGAPSRNSVIGYYTRYAGELIAHPLQGIGGVTAHLTAEEKRRRAVERNRRYAGKSIAVSSKKRRGQRGGVVSKNRLKPVPVVVKAAPIRPSQTAGVPLLECGNRRCKFAITPHDVPKDAHLFCGEVTEPGKSWCAWHEQIVWQRREAAPRQEVGRKAA